MQGIHTNLATRTLELWAWLSVILAEPRLSKKVLGIRNYTSRLWKEKMQNILLEKFENE